MREKHRLTTVGTLDETSNLSPPLTCGSLSQKVVSTHPRPDRKAAVPQNATERLELRIEATLVTKPGKEISEGGIAFLPQCISSVSEGMKGLGNRGLSLPGHGKPGRQRRAKRQNFTLRRAFRIRSSSMPRSLQKAVAG